MIETTYIDFDDALRELIAMREKNPLIHCMTNEVVQEITADVLLAAGASPAMVVAEEEAGTFAGVASGLLINLGTPYPSRLRAMKDAVAAASKKGTPWVLDPVAAGGIPWRNDVIKEFLGLGPTAVRGNASEILFLAGRGSGGKGVDSTDKSDAALEGAIELAKKANTIVVVTGETDYCTDGDRIIAAKGGDVMITKVVGTGCSLSALLAAFLATGKDPLVSAAACCACVNRAGEQARIRSRGPGSFHPEYLDALYNLGVPQL